MHFAVSYILLLSLSFGGTRFTTSPSVDPCDSIPELNQRVMKFVDASIGKKIGTGECWDFAADALRDAKANWDGRYKFGVKVDVKKDCVYPGDIIQFEGVRVERETDDGIIIESMSHHTAIVYSVAGPGRYQLAHQNIGRAGKKVGVTELDLENIKQGRYTIFRPVK